MERQYLKQSLYLKRNYTTLPKQKWQKQLFKRVVNNSCLKNNSTIESISQWEQPLHTSQKDFDFLRVGQI